MNWYLISPPLIVVSVLLYHLAQKNMPKDANPLIVFASAYLFAISICITVLAATGEIKKGWELVRNQNWFLVLLLGISAVGVELGFLYAYRTGWKISTTAVTTGSFITICLALIGVLWFKEELTVLNVLGIALCVVGVICINIK
jgi:drug/metabolite transporter (DMT)-like permease